MDAISPNLDEDGAVALMDRLSLELGGGAQEQAALDFEVEGMDREEMIGRLRPFFAGLARRQFESVLQKCGVSGKREEEMWKSVVGDVFTSDDTEYGKLE